MRALVVFHGASNHPLAWLLKPGFKHVFTVIQSEYYWTLIDGRAGVPVVEFVAHSDCELAEFYREQGYTVVETYQRDKPLRAPYLTNNCVGLAKAVLCIRSFALTPYQLYCGLLRDAMPPQ